MYSQLPKKDAADGAPVIELQVLPTNATNDHDDENDESENDAEYFMDELDNDKEDDLETKHKKLLQLYRLHNIAVPLNYFTVGVVQGLVYPLLNVYPLDLHASEAQQTTILTLKELPSCFKIAFGFLSDNVPIRGQRRKPYLWMGWLFASCSLLPLLWWTNLTLQHPQQSAGVVGDDEIMGYNSSMLAMMNSTNYNDTDTTATLATNRIAPDNAPGMPSLSLCFFLWANGVWLADVMGDSLVAEKAKYETDTSRGDTQFLCYLLRGFGFTMTAPLGSMLYSHDSGKGPLWIVLATVLVPVVLLGPAIGVLYERPLLPSELLSTRQQIAELWNTACSKAVWLPMGFCFLQLACFVTNSAWKQYLETVLGFTPNQLNALMIIVGIFTFAGIILYKLILYKWSWRTLYVVSLAMNGVFSALQLLLIEGKTFGISPFVFCLGDDAVQDFIMGVQYLPMVILMVNLVPNGIEGASYALFTTTWNVAGSLSDSLSTMLLAIWDVSKETMQRGDLSGLAKLTILTTVLQSIPIAFVGMLPHSAEHLQQIKAQDENTTSTYYSRYGGTIYISVVVLALLWTIVVDVMNIVYPGWMGESR